MASCKLHQSMKVMDAIQALERGATGIALITDNNDHLLGILTDGDLRRAYLEGATLDSPILPFINRNYVSVTPEAGRAEVIDLMQARVIQAIPIVGPDRRLLGLHTMHEVFGGRDRSNWTVVMAGGRGSRLNPMTETVPKPMVKVAGRPILERIVLHLLSFGIRRIFLSVNYMAQVIVDHFGDGSRFGCRIEYLREDQPLGTAGGLSLLGKAPEDPLLVLNGDLITEANLGDLLDFHQKGGYIATMGVRQYIHQIPFGCVDLDGTLLRRLQEKPVLDRWVNAGMYVLDPALLARIPRKAFDMTSLFENCIERGEPVGAFKVMEDWIDVGNHDQLLRAQQGNS